MAELGTVIKSSIGTNRDQTNNVRLVRCEMSSPDDIQTIQLAGGIDQAPLEGAQLLVFDVGLAWKIGFVLKESVDPSAANGEKYLGAIVAESIVSSVKCKADGTVVINDGSDTAVAFSRLKTAFDQLKTDFNNLVTFINGTSPVGHIHTCPSGGGPTTAMVGAGVASSASIDPAESNTVKIP